MKLLHIDAGITGPASVTRQLSAAVVSALTEADPALEISRRDLNADPVPHVDGAALGALADNPYLQEFLEADVLVIGAPMYNFAMASQLKAWFDHLLVAGATFRYGPNGAEGLIREKSVIVAVSKGGVYAPGTPAAASDFHEPHIRLLLGFMGIENVTVVKAEGVALGPDARTAAIAAALDQVRNVAEALPRKLAA